LTLQPSALSRNFEFEGKPSSRREAAFFHAIVSVYLRNERMAMISMPKVSMSINDSYVVIGATSLAGT
jgi:hypothetical protein